MYVCFVRHADSPKQYLFDCDLVHGKIACGYSLVCETQKGIKSGTVVTYPTEIRCACGGKGTNEIIKATGAYLPLRKILRIEGDLELTRREREKIASEMVGAEWERLPFA